MFVRQFPLAQISKNSPNKKTKPATRAGSIVYYVGKTDSKRIH